MSEVLVAGESAVDAADEPIVIGSLSPSRAADFKTCPLLYRLPHDRPAARGARSRGHARHRRARRPAAALRPARRRPHARRRRGRWSGRPGPQLLADEPELATLFADDADGHELADWLESANRLVDNYFALEDPTRLEPAAREQLVEVVVDGLRLRGYVDRLDVTPAGDIRVVDYKTGSLPREAFEAKALFQMKFYALVLWRTRGVVPRQLKLIYLADRDTLSYSPDADELERFERTLRAIWAAIDKATAAGRVPAEPEPAVRLVRSPRAVPGLRRHSPAVPVRVALRDASASRAAASTSPARSVQISWRRKARSTSRSDADDGSARRRRSTGTSLGTASTAQPAALGRCDAQRRVLDRDAAARIAPPAGRPRAGRGPARASGG